MNSPPVTPFPPATPGSDPRLAPERRHDDLDRRRVGVAHLAWRPIPKHWKGAAQILLTYAAAVRFGAFVSHSLLSEDVHRSWEIAR